MSKNKLLILFIILALFLNFIVVDVFLPKKLESKKVEEVSYSRIINLIESKEIEKIELETSLEDYSSIKATGMDGTIYSADIPNTEIFVKYVQSEILLYGNIELSIKDNSSLTFGDIFLLILLIIVLISLISMVSGVIKGFSDAKKGNPPSFMNLGLGTGNSISIEITSECDTKFSDVAGLDVEKEEVTEIVDFLKNPKKYTDLGARIPKGALLSGPPGTGKTLLAKAVAGEAGVPFISVSGSHFVEMFVGLGASRVRELFKEARKNAPCIIFIDEIDAIGRKRSNSSGGGHSEHDQTLEQLLFELDGFKDRNDVILLAATNRPDSLDPALTRPGRFDRKIEIGLPDIAARLQILQIHAKNKPFFEDVDFKKLAYNTAGCSGADLANLLNESALIAARKDLVVINNDCINAAFRKLSVGLEKHNQIMTESEKKRTAVHELGHTLASIFSKTQTDIKEISIIPTTRGAGGYTMNNAQEEQMYKTETELFERIVVLLAGRAAEREVLGEISTGALNDLKVATRIAGEMVSIYGMNTDVGPISIADTEYTERSILGESTYNKVGDKVLELIKEAEKKAQEIIHVNTELLGIFTEVLLEKEVLTGTEIEKIVEEYNKNL